ncbi:hypothetical protein [Mycobacterium sp.]|uniref:hypothetical protein n=1 Tax=Mycobacterium sp. TaxID=1785 RepID=UPI003342D22C|nr:hypothetical protein [Mycobacterium sp.]
MAEPPAWRTGYMSVLLPVETGEGEVRRVIRESVIRALAAAGEWPIRVHVVTSKGSDDGRTKRWFVEYETGPYGEVIDQPDQPDQCG